jgi:hypothetical protein
MLIRLKRTIGACMLVSALLPGVATYAATYYVATTGSNSNPGAETQPWQTVAFAVNTMVAGDTTYVKGGIYNEGGDQLQEIRYTICPDQAPECAWRIPGY